MQIAHVGSSGAGEKVVRVPAHGGESAEQTGEAPAIQYAVPVGEHAIEVMDDLSIAKSRWSI